MLTFTIKEKEISITVKKDLLRGTVGAKCKVKFENFWNKYNKTIVFKRVSSGCSKPFKVIVNAMESTIEIPWEILVESGAFQIGAYGVTENEVLPTLWSEEIKIEYATDTNGETPKPYSLNEIEQLKLQKQNKLTAGANIVIDENNVISSIGGGGGGIVVDTTYNPESENAQSGKAVAEAIKNIPLPNTLLRKQEIDGTIFMPAVEVDAVGGYSRVRVYDELSGNIPIVGVDTIEDVDTSAVCVGFLNEKLGAIETTLDSIIAIQNELIGGNA